jgi:hypothetical protein
MLRKKGEKQFSPFFYAWCLRIAISRVNAAKVTSTRALRQGSVRELKSYYLFHFEWVVWKKYRAFNGFGSVVVGDAFQNIEKVFKHTKNASSHLQNVIKHSEIEITQSADVRSMFCKNVCAFVPCDNAIISFCFKDSKKRYVFWLMRGRNW